jgi:hypothetical protein
MTGTLTLRKRHLPGQLSMDRPCGGAMVKICLLVIMALSHRHTSDDTMRARKLYYTSFTPYATLLYDTQRNQSNPNFYFRISYTERYYYNNQISLCAICVTLHPQYTIYAVD